MKLEDLENFTFPHYVFKLNIMRHLSLNECQTYLPPTWLTNERDGKSPLSSEPLKLILLGLWSLFKCNG